MALGTDILKTRLKFNSMPIAIKMVLSVKHDVLLPVPIVLGNFPKILKYDIFLKYPKKYLVFFLSNIGFYKWKKDFSNI